MILFWSMATDYRVFLRPFRRAPDRNPWIVAANGRPNILVGRPFLQTLGLEPPAACEKEA